MGKLSGLASEKVFEYFELLCSVPHGSGNTDAISSLCVDFAKEHGYRYVRDEVNNVVIYAPASEGYENAETVILQGHMDMVCAKAPGNNIDMQKEPISVYYEDDFVKAKDTSLGGDDCIAVAMIMAILDSKDIPHPAIEAVFTVDEEIGLLGAAALDGNLLSGKYLINIDSEEEGVFTCGCAGGVRFEGTLPVKYEEKECKETNKLYTVKIGGLMGGHSGCDIEKGRANSNHLMGRMLNALVKKLELSLVSFEGGHFDNVIAAETTVGLAVKTGDADEFEQLIEKYDKMFKEEYASSDAGVYVKIIERNERNKKVSEDISDGSRNSKGDAGFINLTEMEDGSRENKSIRALTAADSASIFSLLAVMPQGVIEMSSDIKGLVQTSLNLGITLLEKECFKFSFCVRSSIKSQKDALVEILTELTEKYGGTVALHGDYPGWAFRRDSKLRESFRKCFVELFGKEPVITATHGGLECGLFTEKVEGIDCISIGPDLFEIHSERERLSISSTVRVWKLLTAALKSMK